MNTRGAIPAVRYTTSPRRTSARSPAAAGRTRCWSWPSDSYLRGGWRAALLPVALLLTAAWEARIESSALGWTLDGPGSLMAVLAGAGEGAGAWRSWLHRTLIGVSLAGAEGLTPMATGTRVQTLSPDRRGLSLPGGIS